MAVLHGDHLHRWLNLSNRNKVVLTSIGLQYAHNWQRKQSKHERSVRKFQDDLLGLRRRIKWQTSALIVDEWRRGQEGCFNGQRRHPEDCAGTKYYDRHLVPHSRLVHVLHSWKYEGVGLNYRESTTWRVCSNPSKQWNPPSRPKESSS